MEIVPYFQTTYINWKDQPKRSKSGVFVNETQSGKVLLVQSRGRLWGPPKGGIQANETPEEAAIRELREETGVEIPIETIIGSVVTKLRTRTVYYHHTLSEPIPLSINSDGENDVNGVGWIHPNCVKELVETGRIELSSHAERLLK